ncbi:MAG TPA: aminotransferase class V-fold PLP-dependent enzyme [Candidatus Limnocylindrales bacterium]|nr:aminotransferase class V-fold PLP-dependent enzyme [Candidatus Limnocylindrales bacterium]
MVSPFLPDDEKLRAVRDALPAVSAAIYLDTATAGPLPAETAAAMSEIADHELRFGRVHPADRDDADARRDEARAALAAILSADVGSIALARGAEEAMAIGVRGVAWNAGDILLTIEGAGEAIEAAAGIARSRGAAVRAVPADVAPDRLSAAAADPRVRFVALPHVDAIGRVLPIADLAAAVREARADLPIVVDGRLAVGAFRVAPDELAIDGYAIAGDAWLLGPDASGGLWLADPAGGRLRPERRGDDDAGDAVAFEAGPLPTRDAVGLARSAGWLAMYVGLDWVLERPAALAEGLRARLVGVPGIEVATPLDGPVGPVIALRVGGWRAAEVATELGRRIFAVIGTVPDPGPGAEPLLRLSLACFNDPSELERVAATLELIASHTPATLPSRPPLTILSG